MTTTQIQSKYYNRQQQSLNFEGLFKIKHKDQTAKVRVLIKIDSYDFQSYATIDTWDGQKGWLATASLNWKDTNVRDIFNQKEAENLTTHEFRLFEQDTNTLLQLAKEIIF